LFIRFGARKLELRRFSVPRENRMNIHQNARLTPLGRERIARFWAEGVAGLADRSSRPKRLYRPTSPAIGVDISKDMLEATVGPTARRAGLPTPQRATRL
jgi:hypothetical protein